MNLESLLAARIAPGQIRVIMRNSFSTTNANNNWRAYQTLSVSAGPRPLMPSGTLTPIRSLFEIVVELAHSAICFWQNSYPSQGFDALVRPQDSCQTTQAVPKTSCKCPERE